MFPVPGQTHKPDPEASIREIEADPLSRLTWWLLDRKAALATRLFTPAAPPVFTHDELAYLQSRRLAHMATVGHDGRPDSLAVGFDFDGAAFYVDGSALPETHDRRSLWTSPSHVALVIDELLSPQPLQMRGIRIHGLAEVVACNGGQSNATCLRIIPQARCSWGINAPGT